MSQSNKAKTNHKNMIEIKRNVDFVILYILASFWQG